MARRVHFSAQMASARALALAAAIAAGCGAKHDDETSQSANEPGVSLSICGVVDRYVAPAPPNDGSLTIDGSEWPIAQGAHLDGAELLERGANICVDAEMDTSGRITTCAAYPKSPYPWEGTPAQAQ
jgi:hypothetical protein